MNVYILLGLYIAFVSSARMRTPRGIRNNNPLNIRKGNNWKNEAADLLEWEFEVFRTPFDGLRAAAKTLHTYVNKHNLVTIEQIIYRWSPPNENDTNSYINSMVQKVGVNASEPLTRPEYEKLLTAMILHENGQQPYDAELIHAAFNEGFT